MKRSHFVRAALTFSLVLPLATLVATAQQSADEAAGYEEIVATDAHNGYGVTLKEGQVLVVRLNHTPSTGTSRALVTFPDMPVRLLSHRILAAAPAAAGGVPIVGAPRVSEWRFVVDGESTMGRTTWLKMLRLAPFAKGVDTKGLWELKVSVPATPAAQE